MERTARSVYLPCGCCFRALVDVERHWGGDDLCFASSSLEEIYHYVYYQLTSVALTMLDDVNGLSINFFSNEFIQAIVNFFTLFAWGLGLTGAAIAIMDFAVSYQTGGGGSFTGTGIDKVKYDNGAKGTVSGGSFAELYLYGSGTAWLAGGSFTKLSTASSDVLSSLLADGAAYYDQSGNAISNSGVSELNNVTVKTHTHTVDEQTGICSVCQKQMAAP